MSEDDVPEEGLDDGPRAVPALCFHTLGGASDDRMISKTSGVAPSTQTQLTSLTQEAHEEVSRRRRSINAKSLSKDVNNEIERVAEKEQNDDIKRMLRAAGRAEKRVPLGLLAQYLETEVDNIRKCSYFPWILLYWATFSVMVLTHEHIVDVSQVDRNYRSMLEGTTFEGVTAGFPDLPISGHKDMGDIDTVDDVYLYLHDAVLPLFLPVINDTAREDRYRSMRYNQLIGGVLLRQTRKNKTNCAKRYPNLGPYDDEGNNPFLQDFECFPWSSTSSDCFGPGAAVEGFCSDDHGETERRLSVAARAARARIGKSTMQVFGQDSGSLFTVVMHGHDGLAKNLDRLHVLQDNAWIDYQSGMIVVAMFILNPDLKVYSSFTVTIYLHASGEVIPFVQTVCFAAEPYERKYIIAFDCIWGFFFLHLSKCTIWHLFKACKNRASFTRYILNPYNWLEVLAFLGGICQIIFWIVYLIRLWEVTDDAVSVVGYRPAGSMSDQDDIRSYNKAVMKMHQSIANFSTIVQVYRVFVSWYAIGLTLRFFHAFDAQPRLAIVSKTLSGCLVEFIHFLIVFLTMFMSFAISAMFLFGHRLVKFSDFGMALQQCFEILLGVFDFDELKQDHPRTAFIWFALFIILQVLIMMNMVLAIIMDTYTAEKAKADVVDSIWDQLLLIFAEWRSERNHKVVRLKDVLKTLNDMQHKTVSAEDLLEANPEMHEAQARTLIEKGMNIEEFDEDHDGLSFADVLKLVVSIKNSVMEMNSYISEIVHLGRRTRAQWSSSDVVQGRSSQRRRRRSHPLPSELTSAIEKRLDAIEDFLNEAVNYMFVRGKEFRDRLDQIEDELRRQNSLLCIANGDLWNAQRFAPKGARESSSRSSSSPPNPAPRDALPAVKFSV